jgi:uncharacterized protein (TIGR02147 family)
MKSVFDYTNYRQFLKDYYEERKAASGFTYRDFSEMTGMNSSSWLLHLIKGAKNLSPETAQRISKALRMGKTEAEYFELMVPFTQAKTSEAKDRIYQRMLGMKRKLKISKVGEEQYDYYTKWYHPVVRSLVTKVDFGTGPGGKPDFAKLAHCLVPAITPAEARKSVKLLEKLDLIVQDADGRWQHKNAVVSTGDELASLNVANYHKQVSRLAEAAYDRTSREERDISALTLGISEEVFGVIKTRIQAFRKEIMELALASKSADRVYQLNFQFFPVGRGQG